MNNYYNITPQEQKIIRLERTKDRIKERLAKGELYESQAKLKIKKVDDELEPLYKERELYIKAKSEIFKNIFKDKENKEIGEKENG